MLVSHVCLCVHFHVCKITSWLPAGLSGRTPGEMPTAPLDVASSGAEGGGAARPGCQAAMQEEDILE